MTRPTISWILNLDADLELAQPGSRSSPRRSREVERQAARFLDSAARGIPQCIHRSFAGDHRDDEATWIAAWCPTPRAIAAAAGAAAPMVAGPGLSILQAVNHRRFASVLRSGLPGAGFAATAEEVRARIHAADPPEGWLLKRPHGFSGRGRKRVTRDELTAPAVDRWIEASMTDYGGGLQVEPFVDIVAEFALHGLLDADGTVHRGRPTQLTCDADGAYRGSAEGQGALVAHECEALHRAFDHAAGALAHAGYFGPFGIDAFRWRDLAGPRFHPLSELNARYTMGFFRGMAGEGARWQAHLARHARRATP